MVGLQKLISILRQIEITPRSVSNSSSGDASVSISLTATSDLGLNDTTPTLNDTIPDSNVTFEYTHAPVANFCFNESQSWVCMIKYVIFSSYPH